MQGDVYAHERQNRSDQMVPQGMKRFRVEAAFICCILLLMGCTGIPEGVTPVADFDVKRYLGNWHEIARLDHRFERGLEQITAQYSLREDGGLKVVNRGFDVSRNQWKEAEGKAYFIGDSKTGRLKVSFFGPFYGGYNIIELDHAAYQYALVCGPDTSYLWILAREPELDTRIVEQLVARAREAGFDTEKLIYAKRR
jgi:apolipoprotein D and lipocalin family protein